MSPAMNQARRTLPTMAGVDPQAAAELLPLVYDELRRLANQRMGAERPDHTLQATALVHEAYLRLVGGASPDWDGKGHFFAAAAEAMRRILIENARGKRRQKHGGKWERVNLDEAAALAVTPSVDLLSLDEALTKFAAEEPAKAELVKLRYFAGLTIPEAAAVMDISESTADRYWAYAKVWLFAELGDAKKSDNSDSG
jgi:RNA polymerase sigma factor (TIGR02999 family)